MTVEDRLARAFARAISEQWENGGDKSYWRYIDANHRYLLARKAVETLREAGWTEPPAPEPCSHLRWSFGPNGTTWCSTCGVETTHMEAMGG